ncbi:hypothetical protein KR009_003544 [Drosophila setifemur]|nr:hypothetical protein KR009_003544 [Drosophila setifemur]
MSVQFVKAYFKYALAIGLTSHRFANQRFESTFFTRLYALVINIMTLLVLPIIMWQTETGFRIKEHLPKLILITYHVRYSVAYVIIIYTVLSRGFRDTALREMQPLLRKMFAEEKRFGTKKNQSLCMLFFIKCFVVIVLCFTDSLFLLHSRDLSDWRVYMRMIFLCNAYNLLNMVPMGYFLALWHISRGYDCVNQRLEEIVPAHSCKDLKEIHHLWGLHAALTKAALAIHKIYSPQMLAIRFDSFVFGVIQAYWGVFFTFDANTNHYWVIYGSCMYGLRSVDYYLTDHISELIVKYQNAAKHAWSERIWTKETSAVVTYVNSSKLELWTCGLYQANRVLWFDMITNILYYFVMLLQFHLVLRKATV